MFMHTELVIEIEPKHLVLAASFFFLISKRISLKKCKAAIST
jgi:hypothetical protein